MGPRTFWKWAASALLVVGLLTVGGRAEAQYKNGQFGFEGGYSFISEDSGLDANSFILGLRGAYKGTDHWWFSARAGVGFRGELSPTSQKTVVVFNLMPVDVRYYFMTDRVRPFLALGSTFNFLFNTNLATSVIWGPQLSAGIEIRLQRDLFLGFQADGGWGFVFEGPDAPFATATVQLLFFL